MEVVVLDSGMGGLEVAARFYERSRREELDVSVRFVNVRPPPGQRFEGRLAEAKKVALLEETLRAVDQGLAMDLMALACNSLSALVYRTEFHSRHGARLVLLDALSERHTVPVGEVEVFVFGTELTIRGGAHRRALLARGVRESQIIEQACPGLANSIQDGHASARTAELLETYVAAALAQRRARAAREAVVLLACSHYAYLRARFQEAFSAGGLRSVRLLCANDSMVDTLMQRVRARGPRRVLRGASISLHTMHPLTASERENFIELITPISAATATHLDHITPLQSVRS